MSLGMSDWMQAGRRLGRRLGRGCLALLLLALAAAPGDAFGRTRIKDMADVEGVRVNQLIG